MPKGVFVFCFRPLRFRDSRRSLIGDGRICAATGTTVAISPVRQDSISRNTIAAATRGTQPPSATLVRFADTNERSTSASEPPTAIATAGVHFHCSLIILYISSVVSSIVSDTATPNAAASLSDEPKARVSPIVKIISNQLIDPT